MKDTLFLITKRYYYEEEQSYHQALKELFQLFYDENLFPGFPQLSYEAFENLLNDPDFS